MQIKDIVEIKNVQFKRCLDFPGDYEHAMLAVKKMQPPLRSGEPMIVSYIQDKTKRTYSYFLAIGRNLRYGNGLVSSPIITPMFTSVDKIEDVYDSYFTKYLKNNLRIDSLENFMKNNADKNPQVLEELALVIDDLGRIHIAGTTGILHNTLNQDGSLEEVTADLVSVNGLTFKNVYDLMNFAKLTNQGQVNQTIFENFGLIFSNSRWHDIVEYDVNESIANGTYYRNK